MSPKYTLRDVFQLGLKKFLDRDLFRLKAFQIKAAFALHDCRTAALGGHVKKCPEGHFQKAWYNSCRHRACPICAWAKIDQWLEKWRQRILPTDHFHITCTLPAELRLFWRYNKRLVGDLLFRTVRQTIFSVLEKPEFLGAKPGLLLNLHTWSRSLWTHVHVHCLVTAGGITPDGRWKTPRMRRLVPTQVIGVPLRKRFTNALERLLDKGRLKLPPDMTRHDARKLITRARRKTWVVNRKRRYRHGQGVATYLARYVRGGPIKNQRLLDIDRDTKKVTFRTSRKGEPLRTTKLRFGDFIKRVLVHVPPVGYRVVRACGLYHHHYAEKLEACRRHLGGEVEIDEQPEDVEDSGDEDGSVEEDYCPVCGCLLEVEVIPRAPPPPEFARRWGTTS